MLSTFIMANRKRISNVITEAWIFTHRNRRFHHTPHVTCRYHWSRTRRDPGSSTSGGRDRTWHRSFGLFSHYIVQRKNSSRRGAIRVGRKIVSISSHSNRDWDTCSVYPLLHCPDVFHFRSEVSILL